MRNLFCDDLTHLEKQQHSSRGVTDVRGISVRHAGVRGANGGQTVRRQDRTRNPNEGEGIDLSTVAIFL